jgi:threonine synthase
MGVTAGRATWLSLGEGSTPLIPARRLSDELGLELHLKFDGLNPTGSFKDRGMAVAVERAADRGARAVVCASTGNTAASAATYAARAGLRAVVLTPVGATADAKRAQAVAAGARLIEIRGSFDDALRLCRELAMEDGFALVNSLNPDRIDGQKSVVGEIVEQLGQIPDVIALPYGGGNTCAVAAGCEDAGIAPAIVSGQAAERPKTFASAIRIGEPAHIERVTELVDAGRVTIVTLTEDELRDSWQRLSRDEGVFCEPASGAGVAALAKLGLRDKVAVAIVTGHGLKDTGAVDVSATHVVDPTIEAVLGALG